MDAVGLECAALVVSSTGGLIAQLVASSHPERVSALLTAPVTLPDKASVIEMWEQIAKLKFPLDAAFVEEFVRATAPASIPEEFLRVLARESLKAPAHVWKETLRGRLEADLPDSLDQISSPHY